MFIKILTVFFLLMLTIVFLILISILYQPIYRLLVMQDKRGVLKQKFKIVSTKIRQFTLETVLKVVSKITGNSFQSSETDSGTTISSDKTVVMETERYTRLRDGTVILKTVSNTKKPVSK